MGRTLLSATQLILHEQDALAKFRRALRQEDQRAFDDLFRAARYHVAAIAYASHLLPLETMLLAMLIEEHKRVLKLEARMGQATDATERLDPGRLSLPGSDDDLAD
jgi:hypothetical protein